MKKEKEKEGEVILDTTAIAKILTSFAIDAFIFHEEFKLTEKKLPCSKVWSFFRNDKGEKIILCSKVTEIEEARYEISLYTSFKGKTRAIIGLYDEINDNYYPKKISKNLDINKFEELVKISWKKIIHESNSKNGFKDKLYHFTILMYANTC